MHGPRGLAYSSDMDDNNDDDDDDDDDGGHGLETTPNYQLRKRRFW